MQIFDRELLRDILKCGAVFRLAGKWAADVAADVLVEAAGTPIDGIGR